MKTFTAGQIVLLRQTQFATSQANAMNPIYIGPYVILKIEHDSVALIKNLKTNDISRVHFNNIEDMTFNPDKNRIYENFIKDLQTELDLPLIEKLKEVVEEAPLNSINPTTPSHFDDCSIAITDNDRNHQTPQTPCPEDSCADGISSRRRHGSPIPPVHAACGADLPAPEHPQ